MKSSLASVFILSLLLLSITSFAFNSSGNTAFTRWNGVDFDGGSTTISHQNNRTANKSHRSRSTTSRPQVVVDGDGRQCNLKGRTIRVAVSSQPPLVDCLQDSGGEWICNGSNIEVIRVLQQKLNFRVEWLVLSPLPSQQVYLTADTTDSKASARRLAKQQHSRTTNRSSGGVLGLVESERAWMSANGFMSIIEGRNTNRTKLSAPFDTFRMHFLLSKSVRDHDHIFVKPFNSQAWMAILASALLIVPVYYIINTTSYYYRLKDVKYLHRISHFQCIRDSCDIFLDEKRIIESVVANENPLYGIEPKLVLLKADEERRRKLIRKQLALERRRALRKGRRSRRSGFFKIAYVVWYVVGSLAAQGGETEDLPEANSTRILIAFWWLYMIVICSIHSGILTAILTFPKQNDFIQTLDDFLALEHNERSGMKLSVDRHSEISNLLSDPASAHRSTLQELIIEADNDDSGGGQPSSLVPIVHVDFARHRQRVLDEVLLGHSAYLEEKSSINLIISQEYFDQKPPKCQFKSSRFPIDIIPMSLVLSRRKFSPICLAEIDEILRKAMQTGLAQKWRRRFEAQGNDCLETVIINAGDVAKIELKHVELAFWLLSGGLIFGSLFLAAEIIWLFTSELDEEEDDDDDDDGNNGTAGVAGDQRDLDGINRRWDESSSTDDSSLLETSSSSTNSDSDNEIHLGHRMSLLARRSLRSLKLNRPSRLIKINQTTTEAFQLPPDAAIAAELDLNSSVSLGSGEGDDDDLGEGGGRGGSQAAAVRFAGLPAGMALPGDGRKMLGLRDAREARRRRRTARAAERRTKRLKRTMGLVKRLHEGRLYMDALPKVSSRIQARARRASHAIVSRFTHSHGAVAAPSQQQQQQQQSPGHHQVRRRRQNNRLTARVSPAAAAAAATTG